MPEIPIPEHIIPFDPSTVRFCGGVAPAVVFCFFESLFLSPIPRPESISKPLNEWRRLCGMRKPQFSKAFSRIGVVHRSPSLYNVARLSGREFWSDTMARHVFYSLEIPVRLGIATLRRNAFDIEIALGLRPRTPVTPVTVETLGAKAGGRQSALLMLRRLGR